MRLICISRGSVNWVVKGREISSISPKLTLASAKASATLKEVLRTMYSLPPAFAFMLYFAIKTYDKKFSVVIFCVALLLAGYQAQTTAQLFYSDKMRYEEDVRLAHKLNDLILQHQPENKNLPVVLVGIYQPQVWRSPIFLLGEVIGHSCFGWYDIINKRGFNFMKSQGIYIEMANEELSKQAFEEAKRMPYYPNPGCVKRTQDYIVVRISEKL